MERRLTREGREARRRRGFGDRVRIRIEVVEGSSGEATILENF